MRLKKNENNANEHVELRGKSFFSQQGLGLHALDAYRVLRFP
jgi:hypothetical protein